MYNKTKECLVNEKIIKILDDEDYVTLNVALKLSGLISTGGQAKFFLQENDVLVNEMKETRRGRKLYPGDVVICQKTKIYIQKP